MEITIEKATQQDSKLIVELLKELYVELGDEAESILFLNEAFIVDMLHSGKTGIYFAKTGNKKTAGIFTLTECQAIYAGGNYGLLDEMYIRPEYRSNNIGSAFMEEIKKIGKQKNWKRIDVTAPTEERWERTVSFYERSGFVFTGPKLKLKL